MTTRWLYAFLILQVLVCACGKPVDEPQDKTGGGGLVNPLHQGGEDEPVTLTVATCNVLKPSGRCDEMSMDNPVVYQTLAKSIIDTNADIIGFNELDETHIPGAKYSLPSACSELNDFSWSLEWPNKLNLYIYIYATYSYANGFAYNNTILNLEESGYVWLSKEDDAWYVKTSSAYGNAGSPERTCLWARFTHISTGKELWLFVTHLPTSSQGGAENMAKVVNSFASHKAGTAPAILTGDMNSAPGSEAYRILTNFWQDGNAKATWGTLSGSSKKYYYSVDTFSNNHTDRRIDHIMTRGCTASDYHRVVVTYDVDGNPWCPSDHLPVVATVKL